MTQSRQQHPGIWALAVTAFAIGVAEFIVVGVLPAIAADLDVPLAQVGGLVGLYALALAIGTPLVVLGLARFPGKPVLLGLIAVFLIGNLLSALSYSYAMLLAGRIVTAIAHGSFFAIGATVATRLAPKGQASRAIALMFGGLTLAMVVGAPLGSLIGNALGWQLPFLAVALQSALGWVAILWWMPALPSQKDSHAGMQLAALARPEILAMMSITILGFGASFPALEQALHARQPQRDQSLIHHSDRGTQYVSIRYTERLAEAGIEPSVGSKGDSYDNALAETINGLYKAELIHRRAPWKTKASLELATLEWVHWFNHHRLLEP